MARKRDNFEQILQSCLEGIQTGQETVDSVLDRYPDQADELRPLLEAASWLQVRSKAVTATPNFVAASRRRLEVRLEREKAAGVSQGPRVEDLGLWSTLVYLFNQKSFVYRFAIATLLVVLFVMTTNRVVNAAQQAIPGDQLYPLKISIEKINLAMAFTQTRRAQLNINFAERRLEEIQRLVAENRFEHLRSTIDKFQTQTEQASIPLQSLESTNAPQAKALASELKNVIDQKAEVLPSLAQDVPQGAQQEITRLIDLTEDVRNEAERIETRPFPTGTAVAGLSPRTDTPVPPVPTDTSTNAAATFTPVPSGTTAPTSTPSPEDILIIPPETATANDSPTPTESPEVDETRIATTTMTPKPALVVSFTASSQIVTEGRRAIPITAQLEDSLGNSVTASQDVSVPFTVSGSAVIGLDFTIASNPLVIPTGRSSADIILNLVDDGSVELDETVIITLGEPSNAELGSPSTHIVTITHGPTAFFTLASQSVHENARSVDIEVQLAQEQAVDVTIPFRLGGTALLNRDYTLKNASPLIIPAGQTKGYISLSLVSDGLDEPDDTVEVTLGAPSGARLGLPKTQLLTLIDDDPAPEVAFARGDQSVMEGTGEVSVQVQLSAVSSLPITVPISLSGSAMPGIDIHFYGSSVVIPPGSLSASIDVEVVDDSLPESYETVEIALGQPENAVLGMPNAYLLTLVDNDPQPGLTFVQSGQSVEESAGNVSVQVQLSAVSSLPITVPISLSGSAIPGMDFILSQSSVVIPPGSSSASFDVQLVDDLIAESSEIVEIALEQPTNAVIVTPITQTITILPSDQPVCDVLASDNIVASIDHMGLEWTLSNLGTDTLLLTQLTIEWPTEIFGRPSLSKVFFENNLVFAGNEPFSPQTITSWISLEYRRLLTSSPSTVAVRFAQPILPGNYVMTLVFHNTTQGFDCAPVIQSIDIP